MSLQITEKDFRFYLFMLSRLASTYSSATDLDFSGMTTKKFYDSIYENGMAPVFVPLSNSTNACDEISYSYDLEDFFLSIAEIDSAFVTYFQNYGNGITSIGSFMLQKKLSVNQVTDSFYYDITGNHFYSGTVFKPEGTVHYTYTYDSGSETWVGEYTNTTYSGTLYSNTSSSGLMTKPQKMKLSANLSNLLVLATFETEDEDYKMIAYLSSDGTPVVTETEVLGLSSLEILNSQTNELRDISLTDACNVQIKYTTEFELSDSFTSEASTTTSVTNGIVTKGKEGSYILQDNDFKYPLFAEPEDGYYFTGWTNGGSNPKYQSYPDSTDIPLFSQYISVYSNLVLDGESENVSDIRVDFVGKQPIDSESQWFIPCTFYPTAIYDDTKYILVSIGWEDNLSNSGTITNGQSFGITEGQTQIDFTFTFKTAAVVIFTTNQTSIPDGYSFHTQPIAYTLSGNTYIPSNAVGDVVDIKAWLVESLPASFYVFNRWTDSPSADYSAIKPSTTLTTMNSFQVELVNLGPNPIEHSIFLTSEYAYPNLKVYDFTNLDSNGDPKELPKTIVGNPDVPYVLYHGTNTLLRVVQSISGLTTLKYTISFDGNIVHTDSGNPNSWTYDIVITNLSEDHTIGLLIETI